MSDDGTESQLPRLVSTRYVVEILDALTERARTREDLRGALHARTASLDAALRTLAAHGALLRCHLGSWDETDPASTRYVLTAAGGQLARTLSRLDVWTALYESQFRLPPH